MSKKEILWREILNQAVENKKIEFTQKKLAQKFGISTSTVFNALKIPRIQGAILVSGRNFRVVDIEKFLYIWATQRNLEKEIIFKTFMPKNAKEIEGLMPSGIIFGCYGAYTQKYQSAPADYDKVYIYAAQEKLEEIKKRFPKTKGNPNIFVLRKDSLLAPYGNLTPDVQTFVDIWNLKDWYAKEFLNKLKEKIIK